MTAQAHDRRSSYRPDIDGLRAIAVLAVVLFHIDPTWLPGGFAGVDVFFVISGYLITGNILKDARSAQGFSWAEFYRRRALRILPVLFSVLLATLIAGHFILLPEDMQELSYSALTSIFSVANVYFTYFLDTSYFADDSSLQPLLHLWSLGVEEQFYLFWPLLLVLFVVKLSSRISLLFVIMLAASSFILAESFLASNPMFAYYMLPTRAGELLVGALLAMWLIDSGLVSSPWVSSITGAVGAGLVISSLVWVTEDVGFPGMHALPATVGAALIIWAGYGSMTGVSRILALSPFVWVGLISYSLYLWHWPVLAFYRYINGEVGLFAGIALFSLMLLLSVFSYRWIEKPLRGRSWSLSQVVRNIGFAGAGSITLLCIVVLVSNGFGIYVLDKNYVARLEALAPAPAAYSYNYVCQRGKLSEADLEKASCVINAAADNDPDTLLWGDSNAAHYVGVFKVLSEHAGFSFRNVAHSSCPPLLQGAEATQKPERLEQCLASISAVSQKLNRYETIILAASWNTHMKSSPRFMSDLKVTIETLLESNKRIILLAKAPTFRSLDRKCEQKKLKLGFVECGDAGESLASSVVSANNALRHLADEYSNVFYIDFNEGICPEGVCTPYHDGHMIYFDNGHLSMEGSLFLGSMILARNLIPDVVYQLSSDNGL